MVTGVEGSRVEDEVMKISAVVIYFSGGGGPSGEVGYGSEKDMENGSLDICQ